MITLYSTNCPKCRILEAKLKKAGFAFDVNTSVDEMIALGMHSAPMLRIGDNIGEELLDFSAANKWLDTMTKQEALPHEH